MKLTREQLEQDIGRLKLSERLSLVEDVWNSIASQNDALPLPEWQRRELDRRYASYKAGNDVLREANAVHDELRQKFQ